MPDLDCVASALCFCAGSAVGIAVVVRELNHVAKWPQHVELTKELNVDYLEHQIWTHHRPQRTTLYQVSSLLGLFGWVLLLTPLFKTSYALSKGGTRRVGLHITIASFAMAAIFMEVMARLFSFGFVGTVDWISRNFELHVWLPTSISGGQRDDSLGYKVLELIFKVSWSMMHWVDAFEWMCYVVIMFLLYYSVATEHRATFSLNWARLGLVVAFLAFLDFLSSLMRYDRFKFYNHISIAITILNNLLFVPIWILWLSFQLPTVTFAAARTTTTTVLNHDTNIAPTATTEMQEFTPDNNGVTNTTTTTTTTPTTTLPMPQATTPNTAEEERTATGGEMT